jgi:hypothetical protein
MANDFSVNAVEQSTGSSGNYTWGDWPFEPSIPTLYPQTYYYYSWPTTIYTDKGQKAFDICKALMDAKLVETRTAKQFVELMETILKVM